MGDVIVNNQWLLSNGSFISTSIYPSFNALSLTAPILSPHAASLETMQSKSRTIWERITGRRKPSIGAKS